MELFVISLILISAIMHVTYNYVLKKTINSGGDSVLVFWLSIINGVLIYSVILFLFIGIKNITIYGIVYSAIFGFFAAIYILFLSKAYEYDDFSIVYPLSRITPLFALLLGIFILKEKLTVVGFIGVILITLGAYGVYLDNFQLKNILKPILFLRKRGPIFAFLAAFISAIYGLYSKLGVDAIGPFAFIFFGYVFLILFYSPLLYFKKTGIIEQIKKFKIQIIQIGILDLSGYFLIAVALSLSKLSYIFALRQMGLLFGVLAGIYFLKEKYTNPKIIFSLIMIIGLILVSIS